jgi:hypothetical protein
MGREQEEGVERRNLGQADG